MNYLIMLKLKGEKKKDKKERKKEGKKETSNGEHDQRKVGCKDTASGSKWGCLHALWCAKQNC